MATTQKERSADRGADTSRYWAFLSYAHADAEASAALHRALERYTLPAAVRRAHGLPKRLIPVFRDQEELEASAGLSRRLEAALDESRWLIVLCSPRSAASRYVNVEVEYFLRRHGPHRILCVLLEGEPAKAFPPAIRALDDEPLAADLRQGADSALAVLKLIAAMATVGFTELRNREAQRRKRQWLVAVATAAALCVSATLYWDLLHRRHVDYYADYVRIHGVWTGVTPVSDAMAQRRNENYRFTRRGRWSPPERVDYVSGGGRCPQDGMAGLLGGRLQLASYSAQPASRYCGVAFSYHQGGALARETWLNERGRTLEVITYTESGLAQFTQGGFSTAASRGGVQYVKFTRDAEGRDQNIQFLHSRDVPRPNNDHHFGYRIDYDDHGRIVRKSALDDAGKVVGEVTEWRYAAAGYRIEERLLDRLGAPRIGKNGSSAWRASVDATGNVTATMFVDEAGQPVMTREGYAEVRALWDERGNNVERSYFDAKGKPVINRDGHAVEQITFDASDNPVHVQWLDTGGKPFMGPSGYAALANQYDERGRLMEVRVMDVTGALTDSFLGAISRKRYDERDLEPEECFFDKNDRPFVSKWGHCIQREFDDADNIREFRFLGPDRAPYERRDQRYQGVAKIQGDRDEGGNLEKVAYFDAESRLTMSGECACAYIENEHDEFGNRIESRRYDTLGRLVEGADGVAIQRSRHDRSGNAIEVRYYGAANEPIANTDGVHGHDAAFDGQGRMIERRFVNVEGKAAVLGDSDVSRIGYRYDTLGEVASETYFDVQGTERGRLQNQRDRYGQLIGTRYTASSGELALDPKTGCAVRQFEDYGVWGWEEPLREQCLDPEGRPVNRRDTGWATVVRSLNEGDRKETYYDAAGREIAPHAQAGGQAARS